MSVDADTDVRDVLRAQFAVPQDEEPQKPAGGKLSKRAEKKVCAFP